MLWDTLATQPNALCLKAGRRGFMAGVAELKAGPTHEQQQHARVLRERLLADLQEQVAFCCLQCPGPCYTP